MATKKKRTSKMPRATAVPSVGDPNVVPNPQKSAVRSRKRKATKAPGSAPRKRARKAKKR